MGRRKPHRWSPGQDALLWDRTVTVAELAKRLGVSRSQIDNSCESSALKVRRPTSAPAATSRCRRSATDGRAPVGTLGA